MLRSRKTSIYRFNHELPPHMPLAVRSVGRYMLTPGSQIEPPMTKWFCELFWSEQGQGEFMLNKKHVVVKSTDIFYLLPGEIHDIRPLSRTWTYHWFTLDHPHSTAWFEAFGLTRRPLRARRCPVELFDRLRDVLRKGTARGDREAAHLAHGILVEAVEEGLAPLTRQRLPWVDQCRHEIDNRATDPLFDITALAAQMGVHRVTLFRAFRSAYGINPSRYLQSRRLHHAMELLKQSDLPIKEVATASGLNDANYMARLLRAVVGQSPHQFRAAYRQGRLLHS